MKIGALATPSSTPRLGGLTYEEFLVRPFESPHVEWVNGKVIPMSPVSEEHQNISGFLFALIRFFVEAHRLGKVCFDPFQMKTGPDLPGRAPDIIFIANENLSRLKSTFLDGPADLVVEIISPDTRGVDRGDKFFEYEQGGVREYWLIDPIRRQAEFYQREVEGVFRLIPIGADGLFHSAVLAGLWLRVPWLWQRPLPPLVGVLKEWHLI